MNLKTALIQKGVAIPNPDSVEISDDIDVDRISPHGVTIHSGCKLSGGQTYIAEGAQIGYEAPVSMDNCIIGPRVALKGGFFQEAVFLEQSSCGLGSHVRQGTILEEQASIAHTVGLKQTILFPYVTLGSLINFCDCLMAGGTSRKNHSEVGSSYIHFNYTPNQDKATASLLGDVPRGVMLTQSPIFLGGQGGLVGPCQLAYGTVVAAGSICRKDQLQENMLIMEAGPASARIPVRAIGYRNLKRIINHNIAYIGHLLALNQWYRHVRSRFVGPAFAPQLHAGLVTTLHKGIAERFKQLRRLGDKLLGMHGQPQGPEIDFFKHWDRVQTRLDHFYDHQGMLPDRDRFLTIIDAQITSLGKDYLAVIHSLDNQQADCGSRWLQGVVDEVMDAVLPWWEKVQGKV